MVSSYDSDGFIRLKNVLSPQTLRYFEQVITSNVERLETEHVPLEKRDTYGKAFLQISNIWEVDREAAKLVMSRKLARIAAELMEVPGVRIYHDQALYKEPGGGRTPWHADQFYWPLDTDKTITVWIPLQQTSLDMGPLAFSRGSQKILTGRDLEISDESDRKIGDFLKNRADSMVEEPFDLGEVSYHSGWTYHRAGPNNSGKFRKVMTIIYFADGTRLTPPRSRYQQNDRDRWMPGAEPGIPVATRLNPLVHPAE